MLRWGDLVTIGVLLLLQIYAYRQTRHYSLALRVDYLGSGSLIPVLYSID
jgi:hypothetical protein